MPARSLPNLALQAFFDLGEDGWKDEMDLNLLKLSVLTQGGVIAKVAADPGVPVNGDVYIFDETHPSNANAVAIRDNGAWVYVTPAEGWLIYDRTAGVFLTFSGAMWGELPTGGGGAAGPAPVITKAGAAENLLNADQGAYARHTAAGAKTLTVRPEATEALTVDGEWNIRNAAGDGNLTIVAGSGVIVNPPASGSLVIPPGGTATLKRVATDVLDLFGQVVAA
jgi:hypothetical protein